MGAVTRWSLRWCAAGAQDPVYQTIFKVGYFVLQPQLTGPLYVRLAFHDAATWNRTSTTSKGGRAPIKQGFNEA